MEDHNGRPMSLCDVGDLTDIPYTQPLCALSFSKKDRLRVQGVPEPPTESLIDDLRSTIKSNWDPGVKKEFSVVNDTKEFALGGHPWITDGYLAVDARRILAALLKTMARHGWNLIHGGELNLSLGNKVSEKDTTLFFEKGEHDPNPKMFVIYFLRPDSIRFVDHKAPNPALVQLFTKCVGENWPQGIASTDDYYGAIDIKLNGSPWKKKGNSENVSIASGVGAVSAASGSGNKELEMSTEKSMLCHLIQSFRQAGYRFYASVNISKDRDGNNKVGGEMQSWVFRKLTPVWG